MVVLKFGGTSVANSTNIKLVADIIINHSASKKLVVVSALGGITDQLLKAGEMAAAADDSYQQLLESVRGRHLETVKTLLPIQNQSSTLSQVMALVNDLEAMLEGVYRLGELSWRSKDRIASYGELLSSKILSGYLKSINISNIWLDSRLLIKTNSRFGNAEVNFAITNLKIQQALQSYDTDLAIAPGFIASNQQNATTTLGRGGSDYTAAIYAAASQANSLEIWTDVSGMMTADPRWVPNAKPLDVLTYQEAMELSHFGAKVIYPPTIQPAMQVKMPVWIKNTFAPQDKGTVIQHQVDEKESIIRGISSMANITLLSLEGSGMIGIPGFSKRLFEALATAGINVILITQGSSEHSICVGINSADIQAAEKAINDAFETEILQGKVEPIAVESELCIVALVGEGMKSHTGISGQMFGALGRNGINIRAIAQGSSEKNISAVIAARDVKKAVNVLHEAFFETVKKQLHVFVVGVGNVGSKLLNQVRQQHDWLFRHLNLDLKIVGIANSRKMLTDADGLDLEDWQSNLQNGQEHTIELLIEKLIALNLRNTVFVDITSSEKVASVYEKLLRKSIAVVACNKIAASDSYPRYAGLKRLAREFNTTYLFETNVGAGLPVISTLNDLMKSGDQINEIHAVLSGTLNFVFNTYDGTKTFAQVVKQAQDEGYTEPDPRLDLGGTDVMRKIMILAREAGHALEMQDIDNKSFMPASCMEGSVQDFYNEMEKHEELFKKLVEEAKAKDCKLKFVASFQNGKASVGLQHIPSHHDFFHLYGKDNIVLFYTNRYPEQPMVIKGAGAGADVTASGVFADIVRVIND